MNPDLKKVLSPLSNELQARLNMIIQKLILFWETKPHNHFTNNGHAHSERIHTQKIAQLARELPESERLTTDEIFIISAAARLYEIGMQSTNLKHVLNIDYRVGDQLSFSQLLEIRKKKHLLTHRLILDSVSKGYNGPSLGLSIPPDSYIQAIAEVCRGCSDEPIEKVTETLPISGIPVRIRLLTALLRLADQLYIDSSRVNLDLLQRFREHSSLSDKEFARWWAYHYAQILPIVNSQIRFHYFLPYNQREYLGHIRALIEPGFQRTENPIILYLGDEHRLHLIPYETPTVQFDQISGFQREMSWEFTQYLRNNITPIGKPDSQMSDSKKQVTTENLQKGQLLYNQYRVIEVVGITAHSQVAKALDESLYRNVAIKCLYMVQQSDEIIQPYQDILKRGARILALLNHPNIGKIYNFMQEPLGIVMEWIEGTSLKKIIDHKQPIFSVYEIINIGIKLSDALICAHKNDVIHRDIKPANIILNSDNEPVLIDFDIARASTQHTISSPADHPIGTPQYMAPEQFCNPEEVGFPTDMFALGLVLYELLTHAKPHKWGSDLRLYRDGCFPKPEQHEIPEPLYQILYKLLSEKPDSRYNASDLKQKLQDCLRSVQPKDSDSEESFPDQNEQIQHNDNTRKETGKMNTITWLHLSDMHYCEPNTGWDAEDILEKLLADLNKMETEYSLKPDFLFFTGDLAFGNVKDETGWNLDDQYKGVNDFLEKVRTAFNKNIPKKNIFLVPGNHDINRNLVSKATINWLDSLDDEQQITDMIQNIGQDWKDCIRRLDNYKKFLKTYGYTHLMDDPDRLIYGIKRRIRNINIGMGGFNSVWSCSRPSSEERGKLWMGAKWQFSTIRSKLKDADFSIALIHHPPSWFVEKEDKTFATKQQEFFKFCLYGHEHSDWVMALSDGHTTISADACYESSDGKNGYNFVRLDFDKCEAEVWLREYRDVGAGGWVPCQVPQKADVHGMWKLKNTEWMSRII